MIVPLHACYSTALAPAGGDSNNNKPGTASTHATADSGGEQQPSTKAKASPCRSGWKEAHDWHRWHFGGQVIAGAVVARRTLASKLASPGKPLFTLECWTALNECHLLSSDYHASRSQVRALDVIDARFSVVALRRKGALAR